MRFRGSLRERLRTLNCRWVSTRTPGEPATGFASDRESIRKSRRFRPTYPGFPVEVRGVEQLHTAFFKRKPHARSSLRLRSRKSGQRRCEHGAPRRSCLSGGFVSPGRGCVPSGLEGESGGIPHLAKNERDAPNFLCAALDRTACAPFFKERRMKFWEPTKLPRKSGMWGTRRLLRG
jgi:hypothetical protein